MLIGTTPTDFTLQKHNGGSAQLSTFSSDIILLSFVDITNGWDWLSKLVEIQNDPSIVGISSNVQIIAVLHNYSDAGSETVMGIPYSGPVDRFWISDKISESGPTGISFPVLVNGAWASSIASQYRDGFITATDPNFTGSPNNFLFSYIISKDYLITDKWNQASTTNANPISFNRMTIGGVSAFNSDDLDNTKSYVIQRILNLNADPTIMYTTPAEATLLTNITQIQPILLAFSKPVVSAADTDGNYTPDGVGGGSLTVAASYTGVSKIENVATLTIGGSLADGAVTITLEAPITDTAGTALADNVIDFDADVTPPTAALTNTPAASTSVTSIDITVGGTDVVSYKYKLDSGAWSAETPVATHITASGLSETTHNLSVIGKDAAGNWQLEASATTHSWTVDTSAPAATLSGAPSTPSASSSIDITVGGTGVVAYKYKLDSAAWSAETPIATHITASGLSDGAHTLSVTGKDAAGNWQLEASATTHTWTIDTSATAVPRDVALVLDYSGSMNGTVDLSDGPHTKIEILIQAVTQFAGVYNTSSNGGVLKVILYGQTINSVGAIDPADITTTLPLIANYGGTSIGGSLHKGIEECGLNDGTHYQNIILVSDGIQNVSPMVYKNPANTLCIKNLTSAEHTDLYNDGWTDYPNVLNSNISVPAEFPIPEDYLIYTVGIGESTNIFISILQEISQQSSPASNLTDIHFSFSPSAAWPEAASTFVADFIPKIFAGSSPQVIFSADGTYVSGTTDSYEFVLNRSAKKLIVSLGWLGDSALGVKLLKGDVTVENISCEYIGSSCTAVITFPNTQFQSEDSKEGIWKLEIVNGDTGDIPGEVLYFVTVFSDEKAIQPAIEPGPVEEQHPDDEPSVQEDTVSNTVSTGDDISLDVSVDVDNENSGSIYSAIVTVEYPAIPLWLIAKNNRTLILDNYKEYEDDDNYLITNRWYDILSSKKSILEQMLKKEIQKIKLKPAKRKVKDSDKIKNVFSGKFNKAVVPGLYKISHKIRGSHKKSGIYERTLNKTVHVIVKPDKKLTEICGWYNSGKQSFQIHIKPKDQFGNLFTPGSAAYLVCTIDGSKRIPVNNIKDNFDGSYTIEVSDIRRDDLKKRNLKIESGEEILFDGPLSEIKNCWVICRFIKKLFYRAVPVQVMSKRKISDGRGSKVINIKK